MELCAHFVLWVRCRIMDCIKSKAHPKPHETAALRLWAAEEVRALRLRAAKEVRALRLRAAEEVRALRLRAAEEVRALRLRAAEEVRAEKVDTLSTEGQVWNGSDCAQDITSVETLLLR